jgi:methionyl aminopeptidase
MFYKQEEIPKLRKAGKLARKMLEFANSLVRPGITTDEIYYLTHLEIIKNGKKEF